MTEDSSPLPLRRCATCAWLQYHAHSPTWRREGPQCLNPKGRWYMQPAAAHRGCDRWESECDD